MDVNGIAPIKTAIATTMFNSLNITSFGDGRYKVEGVKGNAVVYSIDGRMIKKMDVISNGSIIDLSAQTNGVYIININGFNQKVVR